MQKNEQTEIQKCRKKIIHNVTSKINYLDKDRHREDKNTFLEKYTLCEILVRNALSYYHEKKGEPTEDKNIELKYTAIGAALKMSGYKIDDNTLQMMYQMGNKRKEKSARELRNGIVHDLKVQDIMEVVNRKKDLFKLLDQFYSDLTEELK